MTSQKTNKTKKVMCTLYLKRVHCIHVYTYTRVHCTVYTCTLYTRVHMYTVYTCTLYLKINFKPAEYFSTHSLSQLACNEGIFWGHASAKTSVNHPLGYHFYLPNLPLLLKSNSGGYRVRLPIKYACIAGYDTTNKLKDHVFGLKGSLCT